MCHTGPGPGRHEGAEFRQDITEQNDSVSGYDSESAI